MSHAGIALRQQQLLVILFVILSHASLTGMDPPRITGTVPIRIQDHFILVSGSIGKLKHLNFAVDTGSACTVLSDRVGKILDLEGEPIQVSAFGKEVTLTKVSVSQLSLGDIQFEGVEARIADLPQLKGVRLDGLIGLDLLKRSTVTFDFTHSQMSFGQPRDLSESAGFYSKLPFIPVAMKIQGEILHLSLDTGTSGLTLYQAEIEERLPIRHTNRVEYTRQVGGVVETEWVILKDVSLGTSFWKELPSELIAGRESSNQSIVGNLGISSLGFKVLQLDFEKGQMSWER
jgi:predicted aspartyl protease